MRRLNNYKSHLKDWDDYEKTMAELETKWESPGEVFDPDASMDWP